MPRIPLTADFIASVDQISHGGGVSSDTLDMVGIKLSGYKQIDFGFYEAVAESYFNKGSKDKEFRKYRSENHWQREDRTKSSLELSELDAMAEIHDVDIGNMLYAPLKVA